MPGGLGLLADQLSNKTAGVAPSDLFDRASQKFGTLSGSQTDSGFRPADATATGDFSPFGSLTQGIGQGIGAIEDLVGGAFRGVGDLANRIDPEQGKRAAAARAAAQPNLAATDSVFGNFFSNVQDKITGIPSGIASIFDRPPAPVSTSSLDFMPRGVSPDLAGFESRFAPASASAPEIGSVFEVDGRSFLATVGGPVELKGTPEQEVTTERPLAEEGRLFSPNEFFANRTGQLARPSDSYQLEYGLSDQGQRFSRQSFAPDGIQNISMVTANEFFRENPEALANIDSDFVRSRVMNPEANQGFFVDQSTGEISIELPGGDGIKAPVANISGMSAPIDFSFPSFSDITDALSGAGQAIKSLGGTNPYRAEAERRRTTSGNVFRPSK